jgi:hypothetical protein
VGRINLQYRQQLYVKIDADGALQASKQSIRKCLQLLSVHPEFRSVRAVLDVDPV